MKERPVNFKADEVRAILSGRKTQFRRVIRDTGLYAIDERFHGVDAAKRERERLASRCPFGAAGDRLWVRETWADVRGMGFERHLFYHGAAYKADCTSEGSLRIAKEYGAVWCSPIYMPREMSRITLKVVSVRVERLQDISEEDAKAEWCSPLSERCRRTPICGSDDWSEFHGTHRENFRCWWGSIYRPEDWTENPWVWAVEFRKLEVTQ